jgi:hypothetical protein
VSTEETKVPSWRLKQEADRRRATEAAMYWLAHECVHLEREVELLTARMEALTASPILP